MDYKEHPRFKCITDEELEKFRNEEYPKLLRRLKMQQDIENKANREN